MKTNSNSGFSLIELMVVITIMAILAVVVIAKFGNVSDEARTAKAKSQIGEMAGALERYKLNCKDYPSGSDGLKSLEEKPSGVTGWNGPYIDFVKDPWGNDYVYELDSANGTFDITSYGADGTPGGTEFKADIKWSERKTWDGAPNR
ncbi:MAG: type II secretion system major pseudopilin GspG [Candidatus Brocadiia bacterium]